MSNSSRPLRASISSTNRPPPIPLPITIRRRLFIIPPAFGGAHLEFGHPADRIDRGIGQPVDRLHPAPVEGHEDRVLADGARELRAEDRRAPPRRDRDLIAAADAGAAR